eukprot:CAMPEP_0174850018 /NCGR_PEP_ID=MMETSP1114-20130205/18679_1 /TAXON_ID=312471 /ORGANISM="Neobodo designis, Strain CCAP 1951/1" /LENGTH=388 /DNA_ID=CAMNT_0016084441 /DNA_START=39 /DNA_END=1205 /DNA_ORIENTATION=+
MRRVLLTAAAIIVLLFAATLVDARRAPRGDQLTSAYSFDQYVADYHKGYKKGTAEYARREKLFLKNRDEVLAFNAHPKRTYTKGINHMSDWTAEEAKATRGVRRTPEYKSKHQLEYQSPAGGAAVAGEVDWRKAFPPVLTAVKDQGMCGDCWAHAVTEAIESAYARATGDLYVLSQQQITSCVPPVQSCGGCDGFFPQYAYDFVIDKGANAPKGLVEEWYYSFTSWFGNTGTCNASKVDPDFNIVNTVEISAFTQVTMNNQTAVIEALNTLGPLSILVDATFWQSYESGVFTDCMSYGPGFGLDHAVMLVGYGTDAATDLDYWIVRNSWSAGWGEAGYIRIAKNDAPQCGDTFTISCVNQSHTQQACGPCGLLTDAQYPKVNVSRRQL